MNRKALRCSILSSLVCLAATAQPVVLTANGQATLTSLPSNLGLPHWSGGALVVVDSPMNQSNLMPAYGVNPVIHVFDPQGVEVRTLSVAIPNANVIWVRGAARGVDGSVAVCGNFGEHYPEPPGSLGNRSVNGGSYLALFANGNPTPRIVRIDPYSPFGLTVAPDGTVWTMGAEFNPATGNPVKTSNGVVRHFDAEGKQLAAVIPQDSLRFRDLTSGITNMASSSYGAAWYQGRSGLYYEIAADGQVKNYPGLPLPPLKSGDRITEDVTSLALMDDGAVFISKVDTGPENHNALYALDRAKSKWVDAPLPAGDSPATLNYMYGGNGNTIVLRTAERAGLGLRFFTVSTR